MKVVLSTKLSNQKKMANFFRPKLFHRVLSLRYCKKEKRKINYYYIYIYIYCIYIYIYIYIHKHIYMYIYIYIYIYVCIYVYVYIYLYIYMYLFMVFSFLGLIFQLHEKMSCWHIYILQRYQNTHRSWYVTVRFLDVFLLTLNIKKLTLLTTSLLFMDSE